MKLVSLISGGIDSPVATYIMSKLGAEIILIHMDNGIYSDAKEIDKVKRIASRLSEISGRNMPLYILNHEENQTAIKNNCDKAYQCVMCKRMMQRIARDFAVKNGCSGIIMGDSLGQVASQTLKNIKAENQDLNFPILRPLIGMDKLEITNIAEKIGTFDISIIQTSGCSAVPLKPITEADMNIVKESESKIDFEGLIRKSVESAKLIS